MLSNDSKRDDAEQAVTKKGDAEDRSIGRMIRAARRLGGETADEEAPLTEEEERIMAEIREQHRRLTKEEIKEMARSLAAHPTKQD